MSIQEMNLAADEIKSAYFQYRRAAQFACEAYREHEVVRHLAATALGFVNPEWTRGECEQKAAYACGL